MAPLIQRFSKCDDFEILLIHSGQHYDYDLYEGVYEDLRLPGPDVCLNCGKESTILGDLVSSMTAQLSILFQKERLDGLLVHGDTATALSGAMAAELSKITLCHVEAGIRTYDIYGLWEKFLPWPESLFGRIVDTCSDIFLAPSQRTFKNLRREKFPPKNIFLTGNTIVDSVTSYLPFSTNLELEKLNINQDRPLIVFSIHRRENVLNLPFLEEITKTLLSNQWNSTIYWSMHRITERKLKDIGLWSQIENSSHIVTQSLSSYTSFLGVLKHSTLVLTDSSSLQEEAITLKKPCVTCRRRTDRPETIEVGGNILAANAKEIRFWVSKILQDSKLAKRMTQNENPYAPPSPWGSVTEVILNVLISYFY
jgi:UDP-N-acetylglucosamine 2-epimerase (non-hydrolysing)